jgi:hypothetical protein
MIFIGFAAMLESFMVEPSAIVWFATELWDVSCAEAGTPKDTLATMNAAVIKYFIEVISVFPLLPIRSNG